MVNGFYLVQLEVDIVQDLVMVSGNFFSDFIVFIFCMYFVIEIVILFGVNCNFEYYLVIFSF